VAEFGSVESTPTIDGRNMVMVIGPLKNKSEAKAEANAQRAASKARAHAPAEEPVAAADDSAQSEESSPAEATNEEK
jgi:translation initiation factor IF-3